MTRPQVARVLTGLSAAGFFLAAALHTSAYNSVTALAQQGPSGLGPLVSSLWLVFTGAMVVLGLIVATVTLRQSSGGRAILVLAGCFPLATAALQLRFLGFIPPVAILSTIGVLTLVGAGMLPPLPRAAPVGAA
jgi:hypothetical protein